MELEFARPALLYLLLLLPLWYLVVWPWAGRGVLLSRGDSTRALAGRWGARSTAVLLFPRILRSLGLAAAIIALAEPQRVEVESETVLMGKAIGLAVDLSSSMLAEDMDAGATRLAVARRAAMQFAATRPLDELTLVGFGANALTRIPPTTDAQLIMAGVESLEVQLVRDGTDIAGALLTTMTRMLTSEREPRVIILLTDGAHNGTGVRPFAAARAAAAMGVKVHAISVLPPLDPADVMAAQAAAQNRGVLEEMQTVLGGIANITGGRYFNASTSAALDSIYLEIDKIESPIEVVTEHRTRDPLHVWMLVAAVMILGLEMFIRGSRWGAIP